MSKAIQCDRCKRYESLGNANKPEHYRFLEGWKTIEYDLSMDTANTLCPECYAEFQKFMNREAKV